MKKILIAVGTLVPFISFAHHGHGVSEGFTITHYFIEPEHAIYTWSFIAGALLLVKFLRGRKASK
jgi:hypothetical protein